MPVVRVVNRVNNTFSTRPEVEKAIRVLDNAHPTFSTRPHHVLGRETLQRLLDQFPIPEPTPIDYSNNKLKAAQVRILKLLTKTSSITAEVIANEAVNGHQGWTSNFLGRTDPEKRMLAEASGKYPVSLLSLGYVEFFMLNVIDNINERHWKITDKGREALAKLECEK